MAEVHEEEYEEVVEEYSEGDDPDAEYEEVVEEYEEQTYVEEAPAPPPAPARPVHPLFGGGGAKNELAAAASRMNAQRSDDEPAAPSSLRAAPPAAAPPPAAERPPHPMMGGGGKADLNAGIMAMAAKRNARVEASGGAAAAPPPRQPDAVAKPLPKAPSASANPMADQVAMLAAKRSQQRAVDEQGNLISDQAPPPRAQEPAKAPTFAHAKLRKTPSAAQREADEAPPPGTEPAFTQSKLRSAPGGVAVAEVPQQDVYGKPPPEEDEMPSESAPSEPQGYEATPDDPGYVETDAGEEYYAEQPQYHERVLISKQEPQVVTQHRIISNDPEYEIVEYRICCTIL